MHYIKYISLCKLIFKIIKTRYNIMFNGYINSSIYVGKFMDHCFILYGRQLVQHLYKLLDHRRKLVHINLFIYNKHGKQLVCTNNTGVYPFIIWWISVKIVHISTLTSSGAYSIIFYYHTTYFNIHLYKLKPYNRKLILVIPTYK